MRQTKGNVFEVILPGAFDEKILFGHLNILTLSKGGAINRVSLESLLEKREGFPASDQKFLKLS